MMPLDGALAETRPYATQLQTTAGVEPEPLGFASLPASVGAQVDDTASQFTEGTSLGTTPQSPRVAPSVHEMAQHSIRDQAALDESDVPAGGTGQQPVIEGKASD